MKGFRPAKPASFAWNYAKTLMQTASFWGVFLVLIPWLIVKLESNMNFPTFAPRLSLGISVFAVASMFGLYSGFVMTRMGSGTPLPTDCPSKLVVSGPYAHVRNPMALAGIIQGVAIGIGVGSWLVVGYALLVVPVWHLIARPPEEADMMERFGDDYREYQNNVRLWLPRITPFSNQR